ncbi:MAG: archaetidylserine decarboxylase [Cyanobacteria bacterium P01_F01_bin.143]
MAISSNSQAKISYYLRHTGEIVTEDILGENMLRWFYEDSFGSTVFNYLFNNRIFCQVIGKLQDSSWSSRLIPEFVEKYQINLSELELELGQYHSFNAFFSRKLKSDARKFVADSQIFCSPGDGKILVYSELSEATKIPVKGSLITIDSLLANQDLVQQFYGGSAFVLRLAPYDYHRFHFPDHGEAQAAKYIEGEYHVVNPIALNQIPEIFCRNKRTITEFFSQNFGKIAYVEVGANVISSIVQTYSPGKVTKGQEKGYFQYGGSTIILLFEPGIINFDEDLIHYSAKDMEVQLFAGNQIGTKRF